MFGVNIGSQILARIAIFLPAFLLAIAFHEFAHALVANWLGDDTAKKIGRLSLNPFKHLDFFGTFFLLIFGIGWARPVPFNPKNFKKPRLYSVFVALAGPLANLIIAYITLYFVVYFPNNLFSPSVQISLLQILNAIVYINVMLGVFNLLPLPPLDGSHLLFAILPANWQKVYWAIQRYAILILILLFYAPPTRKVFINTIVFVLDLLKSMVIKFTFV